VAVSKRRDRLIRVVPIVNTCPTKGLEVASSNIPYFRFYPTDFMHGVRGMSAQEVGVYTMILCRIYESSGPIEYNPMRLATYCGMRLLLVFDDAMKLEKVPMGSVADRIMSFVQASDPMEVHKFRVRNEDALRDFWAAQPSDALALKKTFEAVESKIQAQANE